MVLEVFLAIYCATELEWSNLRNISVSIRRSTLVHCIIQMTGTTAKFFRRSSLISFFHTNIQNRPTECVVLYSRTNQVKWLRSMPEISSTLQVRSSAQNAPMMTISLHIIAALQKSTCIFNSQTYGNQAKGKLEVRNQQGCPLCIRTTCLILSMNAKAFPQVNFKQTTHHLIAPWCCRVRFSLKACTCTAVILLWGNSAVANSAVALKLVVLTWQMTQFFPFYHCTYCQFAETAPP